MERFGWACRSAAPAAVEALIVAASYIAVMIAYKMPLLRLPYYGDALGGYIPLAHDMRAGNFYPIPVTDGVSDTGHPPLLGVLLAAFWMLSESRPLITHGFMQVLSSLTIVFTYLIGRAASGDRGVGLGSAITVAVTPLFFFGSSSPQADTLVTALTVVSLYLAIEGRLLGFAVAGSLMLLAKETGILLVPVVAAWLLVRPETAESGPLRARLRRVVVVSVPVAVLGLWFAYHWALTGYVYSNTSHFPGGLTESALLVQRLGDPVLLVKRVGIRLIQLAGTDFKWVGLVLIVAAVATWAARAVRDCRQQTGGRGHRPAWLRDWLAATTGTYGLLCLAIVTYVAFLAVAGFLNPRYLLPVTPTFFVLVVAAARSLFSRQALFWVVVGGLAVLSLAAHSTKSGRFGTLEDNYEYVDLVRVHQQAATFLETHFPDKTVLTAYPGNFILRLPYLGYVSHPLRTVDIRRVGSREIRAADYDLLWYFPDNSGSERLDGVLARLRPPLLRRFEVNGKWTAIYTLERAHRR